MLQISHFIVLLLIPLVQGEGYNMTKVTGPIIREELFEAYLYNEVWTTIHYIDLKDLRSDLIQLQLHLDKIREKCQQQTACNHLSTMKILQGKFVLIQARYSILTQMANRYKRGLFNIIGSGMKYLFGTMSANDTNEISNEIDNIYKRISQTVVLLRNQTSLVRNAMVKLEHYSNKQTRDIRTLESIVKNGSSVMNNLKFNNLILETILETQLHVETLENSVSHIEDAIQSGKTGLISPQLVTPNNFINALLEIKNNLNKELPFSLKLEDYH